MADRKPKPGGGGSNNSALELIVFGGLALVILTYFSGILEPFVQPVVFLEGIRAYFAPWFSENLWWLEVVAVLLSALFLWGIISISHDTQYMNLKTEQFLDTLGKDHVSRRRSLIAWKEIQKRMRAQDQNEWKKAILVADRILHEILKMSGYIGSMKDVLADLTDAQLKNIEDVRRAHAIAVKVQSDLSYELSEAEAREAIGVYEQSFKELNLLSPDEE
ncbi:hypothetical protein KGO95_02290 [Patescibacteria group bacterium]|nr:hypothetical protein [Patescibacteria group bacterium]